MFVVRETFTAKPGQASKLATMFKDAISTQPGIRFRVLTDHVADFNTVVLETEVEQLAEFDAIMKEYASRSDLRERLRGYTELWQSGRREIYRVV
jgi:hypothetical protein